MLAGEGGLRLPGDQGVDPHTTRPGDLQRQPADRAGRPGDQRPLAGLDREPVQVCQAVSPGSGKVTASARLTSRGARATAWAGSATRSAQVPRPEPSWCDMATTRSPGRRPLPPPSTTMPARSQPSVIGAGGMPSPKSPSRVLSSTGLILVATARIRTSPVSGPGSGTSATRRTSGVPKRSICMARTKGLPPDWC
ncbi:hypothetical protein SCATT_p01250 (plasmid) [Streptantibioticus cattleyicolor NRRL 8057 = DSM 46488]|uniref:Uncharacterized protein n=1 Tax=Streptantibioticus cattleyicolor (strain ATCC 35852 / DSM 46488 / JCM 4925 / NBRC 14057 / NRRL 8057) TaxID=1003195 RepID=G8XE55_STREN|nr:hypothetical protein SCATT_p01250 [Streptantibioticus cattleyicolor NRRL 8057 = DSM 46488]